MSQASQNIAQQFIDGGVVPAQLVGQNAVSKTFVEGQLTIRDQNISAVSGAIGQTQLELDQLENRVDRIIASAGNSNTEIVDARGSFPVLGSRLGAMDNQISNIKSVMIASYHGVDATIGNADATSLLNNLFIKAKNLGKKYIFFDVPHVYHVNGDLTHARDLILVGSGASIKTVNQSNFFIQICDRFETYNGKYNSMGYSGSSFKTVSDAIKNNIVNVCVWGDSISTGGGDCIGITYSSSPPYSEGSPNGLTPGDSYYHRLIDILTTQFKGVTFNFYNRAIGGTNIQQWQTSQTFNGVTKSWIDHVKDTTPDLLIIAFGMNNGSISSGKEFAHYMDQVTNYLATGLAKAPSYAWVTAPRSVLSLGTVWGDVEAQFGRELAAYAARNHGKSKGHYIIDVNRVSNIKRFGKDFENTYMKEYATTESQITGIVSGNFKKSGSEYLIKETDEFIQFNVMFKDFVVEFEVNFGNGNTAGGENIWFAYNQVGTGLAQESVILFQPKVSTNAVVQSFTGYLDVSHWSSSTTYNAPSPWDNGTYHTVRIEKRNDIVDVFVNGLRVIRDRSNINNMPGLIGIKKNSSNASTYRLRNFKLYEGKYRHYLPSLTEYEMWGLYQLDVYDTKPEIGGNGVNHPSTVGIEEVYVPAIKEFVNDLMQVQNFRNVAGV